MPVSKTRRSNNSPLYSAVGTARCCSSPGTNLNQRSSFRSSSHPLRTSKPVANNASPPPPPLSLQELTAMTPTQVCCHIHTFYPASLADTTFKNYSGIAMRLDTFAKHNQMDPWDHHTMTSWVISTQTAPQGQLSYNKVCSAILKLRAQMLSNPLSLHRKNLAGLGGLIPIAQAPALPIELLSHQALQPHRLAVLLAWKSASRWDEIHRLTKSNFIFISETEIIIDWFVNTKASRTDPFRCSRFTVIAGQFTAEIYHALQRLHSTAPVTLMSTTQMAKVLKSVGQFSAHSFKAGAIDVLTRFMKPGLENEMLLARLAKHKHPLDLPHTSNRYPRDPVTFARFLGTQNATILL